jgi:hypothetical protein
LKPRLEEAQAGKRHVFFVDAAHMVYGTFLCCLWSFVRLFVRAASGRQRFNVLGAWNAMTRELIAVTNSVLAASVQKVSLPLRGLVCREGHWLGARCGGQMRHRRAVFLGNRFRKDASASRAMKPIRSLRVSPSAE